MKAIAVVVAIAACGSSSTGADAPSSATVTTLAPGFGRIVSSPAGLRCGRCDLPDASQCITAAEETACSAAFDLGTVVDLAIVDQMTWTSVACFVDGGPVIGLELTVTANVTVTCSGEAALGPTSGGASNPSGPGGVARE